LSAPEVKNLRGYLLLLTIAALALIADQASKYIVANNLAPHQEWAPIPALQWLFAITYITNTGSAFGLFPDGSLVFIVIAIVVVVAILVYHRQLAGHQWLLRLGLGLQLGGALGNLVDRLTHQGHVVDFIYFKFWPVFNIADSCIVVGVALMAYFLLREGREEAKRQPEAAAAEGNDREHPEQNLTAPR
jgi:signal peptidase II